MKDYEYAPTPEEHKIMDQSERAFEEGKHVTQEQLEKELGL